MSNATVSHSIPQGTPSFSGAAAATAVALALWLALVFLLGARGAFVASFGTPPLGIFLGATIPIVVFLAAVRLSRAFRDFVMAADLPLITAIQAWRFVGFGFIALYAQGILPGSFALPAGLGDMAIGLTAPWVMLTLLRQPEFLTSRSFRVWNLLGMLDLVTAVSSGALSFALATGAAGEVTTGPMAALPLLLIPVYLVPLFFILHLMSLMQARRARQGSTVRRTGVSL